MDSQNSPQQRKKNTLTGTDKDKGFPLPSSPSPFILQEDSHHNLHVHVSWDNRTWTPKKKHFIESIPPSMYIHTGISSNLQHNREKWLIFWRFWSAPSIISYFTLSSSMSKNFAAPCLSSTSPNRLTLWGFRWIKPGQRCCSSHGPGSGSRTPQSLQMQACAETSFGPGRCPSELRRVTARIQPEKMAR